MKTILTTLNSKFIHSNLAIRYLKTYAGESFEIENLEFTINQNTDEIAAKLIKQKPELIAFSVYIWNVEETLDVINIIKLVRPNIKILLGGPEVSYDPKEFMQKNKDIDYIIFGEGERTFKELLEKRALQDIKGLCYRLEDGIYKNSGRELIEKLSEIPFPYDEKDQLKNRIVYYEASRGCPFNCKFCLSSTIDGVRRLPIERVKKELDFFIRKGAKQVKFIDRTFNANRRFFKEILEYLIQKEPHGINFHFEITADLINEEELEIIKRLPKGLVQMEIGVQSTNKETLKAIGRNPEISRITHVCEEILKIGNIHLHLDLIAGLPYEDYETFAKSFNQLFKIRPHKIQLGFLKLLKGSELRIRTKEFEYKYIDKAPYEVIEAKHISYEQMRKLHNIESLIELYYDEGNFEKSIDFLIRDLSITPFKLFEELAVFWELSKLDERLHKKAELYYILLDFSKEKRVSDLELFKELLIFDYASKSGGKSLEGELNYKNYLEQDKIHQLLKTDTILAKLPIDYKNMTTKKLIKQLNIRVFNHNISDGSYEQVKRIYIFDISSNTKAIDITEYYNVL